MSKYKTTLDRIYEGDSDENKWKQLITFISKKEILYQEIDLETVLELNGIHYAIYILKTLDEEHLKSIKLLTCDIAQLALVNTDNEIAKNCLYATQRYIHGKSSLEELSVYTVRADLIASSANISFLTIVLYTLFKLSMVGGRLMKKTVQYQEKFS
jgi:hypothetical protein